MNVFYNPGSLADVSAHVQWATWLLDHRTDMDAAYAGQTSTTTPGANEILIRPATTAEWAAQGYTATTPNAGTFNTSSNHSALLLLNPYIQPTDVAYEDLIAHEFGHAFGYFTFVGGEHSVDSDDLMYPSVTANSFPLTTADMNGFRQGIGARYPATDTADTTSAVRGPNGDVWIPDINGNQVHLDYIEGSPANAPRFLIASNVVNEESTGAYHTAYGSVTLPVHSMGADYMTTLTVVGSEVHVTNAYLI